jgi:hypothetical protein
VLALAALSPAAAEEPKEGDFPKWNTWKLACKGDWAEYAIGDEGVRAVGVKYEILDVTNSQIKYVRKSLTKDGEVNGNPIELTRTWDKIRFLSSPSVNQKMEWRDDSCEMLGSTLKCRVAYWSVKDVNGKDMVSEYWYSADIPCGGLVKVTSAGVMANWITGFAFNGKTQRNADGKAATATEPMPRFYAKAGNWAVYKIFRGEEVIGFQKRTVTASDADLAKYQAVACDAEGTPVSGAKPLDLEQARKEWHNRFEKPAEKDVKLKVGGVEYTCNLYKEGDMGGSTQTWLSDGVIIKIINKRDDKETSLELVKLTIKS